MNPNEMTFGIEIECTVPADSDIYAGSYSMPAQVNGLPYITQSSGAIKAITLHQPWASLIAAGLKTIETRTWATNHRGPLAIHASMTPDLEALSAPDRGLFDEAFSAPDRGLLDAVIALARRQGWELPFPTGVIVAMADLVDCRLCTPADCERALCDIRGRFGWVLENIRPLPTPIPCRGSQRIWTIDAEVASKI